MVRTLIILEQGVRSMPRKKKASGGGKYRSAITGRYVSEHYGKRNPKKVVKETK